MDILSCQLREATDKMDKLDLNQKLEMSNQGCHLTWKLQDKLAANEVPEVAFLLKIIMAQQVAYELERQRIKKWFDTDEKWNEEGRLAIRNIELLKAVLHGDDVSDPAASFWQSITMREAAV
jgi:hypothetical protein